MWLRNCWYVIAWEHDIPAVEAPTLFSRVVLGEPVLVFRKQDGQLAAIEDRCCHRHAPLSAGRREGDCIRCGYHGLMFDARGACVDAPGIGFIPESACVRTYPVAVRNRWVFVWMGDPDKADPGLLPDNFSCEHEAWKHRPGYLHYDTPYLLICDNLLDFSHLSYVHEKTLGGSTAIAQAKAVIEPVPGPGMPGIKVTRRVPGVPPPPFYKRMRAFDEGALLDRWFDYEFLLPGTLLMHSGGRPVEDDPDDMRRAVRLHSCQTLTPETATTTHYFFQQSHPSDQGDDTLTEGIYQSLVAAFEEDRAMITAQHRTMQYATGRPMVPLPIDGALVQFRRLLAGHIQAESQGESGSSHGLAGQPPRPYTTP